MSWLFKSLHANDDEFQSSSSSSECLLNTTDNPSVKGDLAVLGEALNCEPRGVADFLAPPQSSSAVAAVDSSAASLSSPLSSQGLLGVRNDLAEISEGFKTGLSLLSVNSNKAIGKISWFASKLLPFQSRSDDDQGDEEFEDESIDGVPGITDEVLNFVTDISSRAEYWTDFDLALTDTDFKMSDVHRIHVSTVEQLIPNISALKLKLQSCMSAELFWMIYFILVLPRLKQHDFELLSTPEIAEARDILLEKLDSKENEQEENTDQYLEKAETEAREIRIALLDFSLSEIDGLEKADSETSAGSKERIALFNLSLSGDENDSSCEIPVTKPPRASSPNGSDDWVQLHETLDSRLDQWKAGDRERDSGSEASSDWFNVEDFD